MKTYDYRNEPPTQEEVMRTLEPIPSEYPAYRLRAFAGLLVGLEGINLYRRTSTQDNGWEICPNMRPCDEWAALMSQPSLEHWVPMLGYWTDVWNEPRSLPPFETEFDSLQRWVLPAMRKWGYWVRIEDNSVEWVVHVMRACGENGMSYLLDEGVAAPYEQGPAVPVLEAMAKVLGIDLGID